MKKRGFDRTVGIAFFGFILFGLPDGLLGVAWPSIQDQFDLPEHAVGQLFAAGTVGFMLTSFSSGRLLARLGFGWGLILAYGLRGLALASLLVVPFWPLVVALYFLAGLGSGGVDSGCNSYLAGYKNTRLMNWLHASFGLGATVGAFVMTGLLALDISWRWGYGMVGFGTLAVAFMIFRTLQRWQSATLDTEEEDPDGPTATALQTLRLPLVWLSIAAFFLYSGLEVSAGTWSFTLFTEGRGVSEELAGTWVSLYWGSFTMGRLVFGFIGDSMPLGPLVRAMLGLLVTGAVMIWLNPFDLVSFVGLAIMGFALAPVFPLLINATPDRLGQRHAVNAIGFQVGAASVGIAVLPWLAGLLTRYNGLEVIGVFLVVIAVAVAILHQVLEMLAARRPIVRESAG